MNSRLEPRTGDFTGRNHGKHFRGFNGKLLPMLPNIPAFRVDKCQATRALHCYFLHHTFNVSKRNLPDYFSCPFIVDVKPYVQTSSVVGLTERAERGSMLSHGSIVLQKAT